MSDVITVISQYNDCIDYQDNVLTSNYPYSEGQLHSKCSDSLAKGGPYNEIILTMSTLTKKVHCKSISAGAKGFQLL